MATRDETAEDHADTCGCVPDDPCFCFPERFNPPPRYKVRYSGRFVEQYRDLSGDRLFPLRSIDGVYLPTKGGGE